MIEASRLASADANASANAPTNADAEADAGADDRSPSSSVVPLKGRTSRLDWALGWSLVSAIALAAPATLLFPKVAKIERGAWWGLVVMISFAGWGGVVERMAFPVRKGDLSLRLVWGAGAVLAIGGLLCLVSLASSPVMVALIVGGVALSLQMAIRARRRVGPAIVSWIRRWPAGVLLLVVVLLVMAGFTYFGGASGLSLFWNDDQRPIWSSRARSSAPGPCSIPSASAASPPRGDSPFFRRW